jgi:hypothetical protein
MKTVGDTVLRSGMKRAPLGRLCPDCYSGALRPSKLKVADLRLRITLRSPVRCQNCGERAWVFILAAVCSAPFSVHPFCWRPGRLRLSVLRFALTCPADRTFVLYLKVASEMLGRTLERSSTISRSRRRGVAAQAVEAPVRTAHLRI